MRIFAIETSSNSASAAIYENGVIKGELIINNGEKHSKTLGVLCESLFKYCALSPKDIDYYAVSKGPGSFTGIRIGIAQIKGLAFPFDTKCIAVSTLEAAAMPLRNSGKIICAVMDARANRVYNALFKSEGGKLIRLTSDRVMEISALKDEIEAMDNEVYFVADAAKMCAEKINGTVFAGEEYMLTKASEIALLANENISEAVDASVLSPMYLSLPQAVRKQTEEK